MATLPDDVKYTQRYNDLKRKVKEIELVQSLSSIPDVGLQLISQG